MKKPSRPQNEKQRQNAIDALNIIYSPAENRFDRITKLAKNIFNVPIALVSLVSREKQWFKSSQGLTASETSREISFCGHAILKNETFIIPNALEEAEFSDNPLVTDQPYIRFYAGHPIQFDGHNIGTLCIIDRIPRNLTPAEIETLQSLAHWVENELKTTALSHAQNLSLKEKEEASRESMVDPLTKTWNRTGIEAVCQKEFSQTQNENTSCFFMLIGVDFFSEINDLYGHIYGDTVLKEIAQCIRSSCRSDDVIGRYEGDEFIVFSRDCSEETGINLAKEILFRINSEDIVNAEARFSRSVSIGATSALVSKNLHLDHLIDLSDKALREAKISGRNCVKFIAME